MKNHIKHNIEVTEKRMRKQNDKSLKRMKEMRYNHIVNVIKSNVDKKLPLLDIGARDGALLDMFREEGFEYLYAIEIWSHGVEIMREKNYNIVEGDAENFHCENVFGTVILSHVLEHCPDPKRVLKNIKESLKNGGYVYIEVPAQNYGDAPEFAAHYSFFPNLKALKSIFDKEWKIILQGKKRKNIFVLAKNGKK